MKFVKTQDLKIGMRLAKPIYNNKGVLLYDRNSALTNQGIESVRNFKLIGVYILEPAEPLPPMTEEDLEFEKFQMVSVFSVADELNSILRSRKDKKLYTFVEKLVSAYGRMDHKINFVQNLRSKEDFVFKHSLNVAILSALISHKMNMTHDEQSDLIVASIVHDIGKLTCSPDLLVKDDMLEEEEDELQRAEYSGLEMIEETFTASPNVKRTVQQAYNTLLAFRDGEPLEKKKMVTTAKVLTVAEMYDRMTAINSSGEPQSELAVLKTMINNPIYFAPDVVKALIDSINLLAEGSCVELSNGEKALVISANNENIFRPMLLLFSTNTIIDLAQIALYGDIEVVDTMKTMDTRYNMKQE